MKTLTKTMVCTMAALAMAASAASPALAQHDRHRDNDGISAGEVIAGALVIGGIAAMAAAADNDRDDRYRDGRYNDRDGRYNDRRGYGYGISPRDAVTQCCRRRAQRHPL